MTVSSTDFMTNWLAANDVNKNWPYDFTILSSDDVVVQITSEADPAV